uniref:15-hydroxyprostaglandin dehydrogenase [NAD(+)] n=1 Tax=Phlebotomus papatasi TaxID=29031 RepID=A0A1B0D5V2_PHLPP
MEFFPVDVTDMDSFRKAFHEGIEKFKKFDIVINSAGIFDEFDFEKMFKVNVCGVVNSCLLAIEPMRQDKGGSGGCVLNISSIAALNPVLAAPLYSATKQAVLTITSSFSEAFFFSRFGIYFHTLCPGATNTRLFTDSFDARCLFPEFAPEYHAAMAKYPIQDVQAVAYLGYSDLHKLKTSFSIIRISTIASFSIPEASKFSAMACPMPLAPPVMRTLFPKISILQQELLVYFTEQFILCLRRGFQLSKPLKLKPQKLNHAVAVCNLGEFQSLSLN